MVTASVEVQTDPRAQVVDLSDRSILNLKNLVDFTLPPNERAVFYRIFELDFDEAPVIYPTKEARDKVAALFGRPLEVRQGLDIVNIVLDEETLINPLRASRPLQLDEKKINGAREIVDGYAKEPNNTPEKCFFCHPNESTPQDPFGSVKVGSARTVANAGSYKPWNSLAISSAHNLLEMTEEELVDMFRAGKKWLQEVMTYDERINREANIKRPPLQFGFMGMNGLFRGGGSIFHPHIQLIADRKPLRQVENLRKRMQAYEDKYEYPYLDELAYCLRPLGLVADMDSAHIVFNPAAKKEKEVIIYSNNGDNLPNDDLARATFRVIDFWTKKLGLTSFDMGVYMAPTQANIQELGGDYHNFFPMVRLVDRGLEGDRTSDFGVMEVYAASVVASDPFKQAQSFFNYLRERVLAASSGILKPIRF